MGSAENGGGQHPAPEGRKIGTPPPSDVFDTFPYNNFMQENTMEDVIPNSNEPPLVSRRPMVHSTSREKLSSTFLRGGGERKELISRKEEVLAIVSEMVE